MSSDLSSIASTVNMSAPGFGLWGDEGYDRVDAALVFERDEWFKVPPGGEAVFRLLDLDWIIIDQYSRVPTKPRPASIKADAKWPESMPAVCRRTKWISEIARNNPGVEAAQQFAFDPIHAAYPELRTAPDWYALAIEREAVIENGHVVGYRDVKQPIADADGKPTGETKPKIVIVNQRPSNFFHPLRENVRAYGQSVDGGHEILKYDIKVTRTGEERNPVYTFIVLPPTPGYDLNDPGLRAWYAQYHRPLTEIVLERAADEYYQRWFFAGPNDATSGSTRPSNDATAEQVAALSQRVMGYGNNSTASPQPAPVPQPAPQAPQAPVAPTAPVAPVAPQAPVPQAPTAPTTPVAPQAPVAPVAPQPQPAPVADGRFVDGPPETAPTSVAPTPAPAQPQGSIEDSVAAAGQVLQQAVAAPVAPQPEVQSQPDQPRNFA